MASQLIEYLKRYFPSLEADLISSRLRYSAEGFIRKSLKASLNVWMLVVFILVLLSLKVHALIVPSLVAAPCILVGMFWFFMQYPRVLILRKTKEVSKEIVFAGRFLVIEMESGVPLYNAFVNIIPTFPTVGQYFREIITKVDLGTPMDDAINEAILYSPSPHLRRVLWQILNSLKMGSDIHDSLKSVVDTIVREQTIELQEYSKKLNPLAMFYMMIAIIVPTLGSAMLAVVSNFISIELSLPILLGLSGALAFVQFMFLNMIKAQRPAVDF